MIAARADKDGLLQVHGDINARLPVVTSGLVSHYPLDGRGGTIDVISGAHAMKGVNTGVDLIEAMDNDWRDVSSWTGSNSSVTWEDGHQALKVVGYHNMWLKTPIIVDTTKHYEISIEVMETVDSSVGLYLGGHSVAADGAKATANYDYTMAANYEPTHDVWITYKLTRTGLAVAGDGLSLSFANVKGWKGSASGNPTIKFYHLGGLFNYSSGGELYVRNPKIVVTDPDVSNNTVKDTEILVERATTNHLENGTLKASVASSWSESAGRYSYTDREGHKVIGWSSYTGGSYIYTDNQVLDDDLSGMSDKTVTFSLMMRRVDVNGSGQIKIYSTPGTGYTTKTVTLTTEFQPVQITAVVGSDTITRMFVMIDGTGVFEWYEAQLEKHFYATSFTDNARVASSGLGLPNMVPTGDSTVSFEVKVNSNNGETSSYSSIACMGNYYTNSSWTIMDTNGSFTGPTKRVIRKGSSGEWGWFGTSMNLSDHKWHTITITKGSTKYSLYFDGEYYGNYDHHTTTLQDTLWIGSRQNGGNVDSNTVRNVSQYNRVLTADEITKLAKVSMSVRADALITKGVNSENHREGTNFPLMLDGYDKNISVTPHEYTALSNENGSFVSAGVRNVVETAMVNLGDITGKCTKTILPNGSVRFENNAGNGTGTVRVYCNPTYLTDGKPYTTTIEYTGLSGSVSTDWCDIPNNIIQGFEPGAGYGKYTAQATRADYNGTYRFIDINITQGAKITLINVQAEYGITSSPRVPLNSAIGATSVLLNYNIIDLKTDFTISGWWYPTESDNYYRPALTRNIPHSNDTGNRILLMPLTSSDKRLKCWIGSGGDESSALSSVHYVVKNSWNFFALRRIGDTVYITLGNELDVTTTAVAGLGTKLNTDETGQYWHIGEYSGTKSEAYHKDYTFLQRGMSTDEVENMYKTKLSSTKDGIMCNNLITNVKDL